MGCSFAESRIEPSDGVAEPQREFWLVTQRTEEGTALPPRYFADRSAAWAARSASLRGRRRPEPRAARSPWRRSFSSMRWTHSRSCALLKDAGMATTAVPSSQNAATVRRRRAERRTTTGAPSAVVSGVAAGTAPDFPEPGITEPPDFTEPCFRPGPSE